jgi:hypothetical protein
MKRGGSNRLNPLKQTMPPTQLNSGMIEFGEEIMTDIGRSAIINVLDAAP